MARKSDIKQDIFKIWEEHLDWSPKEIRSGVLDKLGTKKSRGGDYPGLRLVQKYVKEFKDNLGQLVDEDKPWSIAASLKYGLPPEATKDLFDIWRASLAMGSPISIRQAKWIVHIRKLFHTITTGNMYSDKVNRNLWLIRQSWLYSILERASRIMGEKYFDTTNLDAASFMPNWERATALKLGKVSSINYPQEALAKIEKHGTSLTSPPVSFKSVEQAVWYSVRAEPPKHIEVEATGFIDEVLPEEDDLVAAYWLMHLSKGPLWNDLPEQPEVVRIRRKRRQMREQGHFIPDSGGFPDDSMYSRQLAIRNKLRKWVKKHSNNMTIRDELSLTAQHPAIVLSPTLLTTVGYKVPDEYLKLYAKLHENELKAEHGGWKALKADVQQRFIHDEQTDDDLTLLEDADGREKVKQAQREQEFIELVQRQGGAPVGKSREEKRAFWKSIRDEWIKKYPSYAKNKLWYPQPEDFEIEYGVLVRKRNLNNKNSDSIEGGTK